MRYRDFEITSTPAIDLERYHEGSSKPVICNGFYCEVYRGDDDGRVNRLDDFTLAEGYEIPKASYSELDKGIAAYVDDNYLYLQWMKNEVGVERRNELIGRLISWIGESEQGAELYDTLKNFVGMEDEEIRQSGFTFLVPYFDRDCYAQTIAEYLIHVGTERSTTGNWRVPFSDVSKKYGIDLSEDTEMLGKICDHLHSCNEIVADLNIFSGEFDMTFYSDYCPFVDEEDSPELAQEM